MIILGLTGGIGMGKSTVARMLRRMGVPVHEADKAVHRLLGLGGLAVAAVGAAFPGVVKRGVVDRAKLGQQVFGRPAALRRLEKILHPLVRQETARWLKRQARAGRALVALDIPLLFESGRAAGCDAVLVVSAPPAVQRARVLARKGMTEAKFRAILKRQMPDAGKRRRADMVIETGAGRAVTRQLLTGAVQRYKKRRQGCWGPGWEAL